MELKRRKNTQEIKEESVNMSYGKAQKYRQEQETQNDKS